MTCLGTAALSSSLSSFLLCWSGTCRVRKSYSSASQQLWRAEHSSRLGEGLKVEMVSQERCVSQEELLALLGLQKVMPGMGSGLTHLLVCQRSLHRAETCVGTDSLAGMYLHWHLQGCPLSCFLSLQFLVCAKCIFLIFSRQQYSVCRFCFFRQ